MNHSNSSLLVFVLGTLLLSPEWMWANPEGAAVVHGEALLSQPNSSTLQVNVSDRAIVNWEKFSIAEKEMTRFVQPSHDSAILNRVVGKEMSQIMGLLEANGKVYLINPQGVIIGKDAVIDTAGFLVSTLDLADGDFLAGKELLFKEDGQGSIINYGTIRASNENVVLLARFIENHGSLEAPQGTVSVAAAQEVLLIPEGNNLLTIRPSVSKLASTETGITQTGLIEAVKAELQADGNLFALGIQHEGRIDALDIVAKEGKILLLSPEGKLNVYGELITNRAELSGSGVSFENGAEIYAPEGEVSIEIQGSKTTPFISTGKIDVSGDTGGKIEIRAPRFSSSGSLFADGKERAGTIFVSSEEGHIGTSGAKISASGGDGKIWISAGKNGRLFTSSSYLATGEKGGEITLLGNEVFLTAATIDASGESAGGTILIGGDFQGKNPSVLNANYTYVNGSGSIRADALKNGDGGKIVVWSDGQTDFYGDVSACGGPEGGNGGFIEVSGKETLLLRGTTLASAPLGNAGSVLLDPKNLTIDAVNGIYPQYQLIDPRQGLGTATFGQSVLFLSTGNIVVTKPGDNFAGSTSGAAYLYNGLTAALISSLTGSVSGDQVGSSTPVALTGNGNYVIISPAAHNGALASAGGVTWGSGTTGVNGSISTSNSLMGGTASDQVGTVIALSNGNYGVAAPQWDNGATTNVGAVTLGNGTSGTVGTLTAAIALIGSTSGDNVGQTPFALTGNGNFVTRTTAWHSGALASVGAATWINGTTGLVGIVSSSNSLVGGSANDQLGSGGVLAISNGNYLVLSPLWDNTSPAAVDAGAVTWGSGTGGVTGLVSSSNSLVGTSASDGVGTVGNVNLLTGNGNYVVRTPNWDNTSPVTTNVGAVTWGNGATGISGVISSSNSLIGANSADQIGSGTPILLGNGNYVITSPAATVGGVSTAGAATWASGTSAITGVGVTSSNSLVGSISGSGIGSGIGKALTNNNYVVLSPNWRTSLAVTSLGAATLGNGTTGTTGIVSAANSIVGSTTSDAVGVNGATVLTNGNFVVSSPSWHNGALANAGAATWSSGTIGSQTVGVVSSANSLVGSSASDSVGNTIALTNGNYVAQTPNWDNGPTTDVGAATWGDGTVGVKGTISSANSLIGSTSGDNVGQSVTALTNGNYVTRTTNWDNGAVINVGAVTWGNGTTGITGVVSSANSLIGSTASDQIGSGGLTALTTGNYVVYSPNWDNGATVNAGAATFGSGTSGITGTITTQNSIVGGTANTSLTSIATGNQDVVNGTFLARFANEGTTGRIRVGMVSPDQLTFARAQAQTVTVTPSFITQTLNAGTALSLQANNDLTINSALTVNNPSGSGGNLTLSAGRSALINANITTDDGSLTIIGNEILSAGVVDSARDAGNATISIASGVTINTGAGNLILNLKDGAGKTNSGSGDLTLGANSTLQASGAGTVSLTAAVNNITLGTNSIVQSMNGNLQLNAGVAITAAGAATVRTTGSGTLILVVDTLFPTSPGIGTGNISAPSATFSTGGGFLRLFTAKQSLNSLPSTINGASYTPGTEFVNSSTEEWGIYYPNGDDGVPFKVFYKNTATPTPPTPSGGGGAVTPPQLLGSRLSKTLSHFYMASSEAFADWELLDQFYVYDYFICEGGTSCPLFNAYEQLQHERSLRGDCVCTFEYFRGRRFYPPVVIRR